MFNILEISRKNSRKKGMVFEPSFKWFKNKKKQLYLSDSKTRNFTLPEYIYIISSYIIFVCVLDSNKKEVV